MAKTKKKVSRVGVVERIERNMPPLYQEYVELVTPSEVSTEFHVFVFMNMIAALAGDKIWFREGNDVIFPSIWTLLLGGSGVGRKSTAFSPAVKMLAKTDKVNIIASKCSPEGFIKELADHDGVGLMKHDELGSLLGSLDRNSMAGFADELCEIYGPTSHMFKKRLVNETIKIEHYAMTWIAATTPDSLNKYQGKQRVAGGFLPRWQVVFGSEPKEFFNFRTAKPHDYFDRFINKLKKMVKSKVREVKFQDDAIECHKIWYIQHRKRLDDGLLGNFEIRIFEVVKKYAVLIAFLRNSVSVSEEDMKQAILFGRYFFTSAKKLLKEELSENQFDADCQKILRVVEKRGKAGKSTTQRDLMRSTNLRKWDFQRCIETMQMRGDFGIREDSKTFYIV